MSKKQSPGQSADSASKCSARSTKTLTRRPLHGPRKEDKESDDEEVDKAKLYPTVSPISDKGLDTEESEEDESNTDNIINSSTNSKILTWKLILTILCGCILGVYFTFKRSESDTDILSQIDHMKNHFNLKDSTCKSLKSELKKVIETREPAAPAIITIVANKGAEITASHFSQRLAETLSPQKYVSINDSTYWYSDPDDIKLKIDEEIKSNYQKGELSVVIVDKFQNIPLEAAMIFHAYCDHDISPIKRAVFLFIVPVNDIIPEDANNKFVDKSAMESLRNIWSSATDDQVDSLITRLTVTVINVK